MHKLNEILYCKDCGGFIEYDTTCVLTSCPPQYRGQCKNCKKINSEFCTEVEAARNNNDS
jgi:hypothetical protein